MFSVVKLKKSFWSAAGCAGYCFAFMHFLTQVGKYGRLWYGFSWSRISLVIGRCYLPCVAVVSVIFLGLFVIWAADIVLINRCIWRGIFAALAVVSAGYLNFVCVSSRYLPVSRFSLAYCRAICFFALVEIRFVNIYPEYYPCGSCVSVFILRLSISNNFLLFQ